MDILIVAVLGTLAILLMTETVWETLYKAWDGLIDRVWRS